MGFNWNRWQQALRDWARNCHPSSIRAAENLEEDGESFSPPDPPDTLHFRNCKGCGGEFIASAGPLRHHPDPEDPRMLCPTCTVSMLHHAERLRAARRPEDPLQEP